MMTVIPGLATAASRAAAAAGRDPHSASSGSEVVKANAFLTVDGDHVRVAEDGGIVYDRDAEGSFTVTARSGWLVEGRETLTVPYSAERPRALKVTGLTGEDGTEVPVEPDDEEEPEEEEDYTLSIKCDRYLGLDRTDSGRLGHTVKTATATLDPSCDGATVTWISCGSLCEFVEGDRVVTNPTGWTVSYRNKDPDTPSTEVDAEELVAEVTIPGKDGTISASKRFTVVKVDETLANWGESAEELFLTKIDAYTKRDGSGFFGGYPKKAVEAMKKYPIQMEVLPVGLPHGELVTLDFENDDVIVNDNPDVAGRGCTLDDFLKQDYYGFGNGICGQKGVCVRHESSSAKDLVSYDVRCCTFTIYADYSGNNSSRLEDLDALSLERWVDMGHSFWKIEIDSEHMDKLPANLQELSGKEMGFYPDGTGIWNVPGMVRDEDYHLYPFYEEVSGAAKHSWHISYEEAVNGLAKARQMRDNPPLFDFATYNCTHAALEIAHACGVKVRKIGGLETPTGAISDWLRELLTGEESNSFTPLGLWLDLEYLNLMYGEKE